MPVLEPPDETAPWLHITIARPEIRLIRVLIGKSVDTFDDNVDVFIDLEDGTTRAATFMTPQNIVSLLESWKQSGEAGSGSCLRI